MSLYNVVQLEGCLAPLNVDNVVQVLNNVCTTLFLIIRTQPKPYALQRFLPPRRSAAMLNMLLRLQEYAFIVSTTEDYSEKDLRILDIKINKLLQSMKNTLSLRTEDVTWTFVKFHMTTHVTWWIKRFGHCGQTDAATLERLHKIVRNHLIVPFPQIFVGKTCVQPDQ